MDGQTFHAQLHVVIDDGSQNRLLHQQLSGLGLNAHLLPESAGLNSLRSLVEREGDSRRLESLHLYAHGEPGQLQFGRSLVGPDQLAEQRDAWRAIGRQLRPEGDLLLYGCNLAADASGRELVSGLARATGRDVAASTDITGNGGDWDLECSSGAIGPASTDALTGLQWGGTLATTLNAPVKVPLHWVDLSDSQDGSRKLGIYATLGGSRQPQLFELDTGGAGFYPAYGDAATAPWWGTRWSTTDNTFANTYDSGLSYTGEVVKADVELFAGATSNKPLLRADRIILGQSSAITNSKQGKGNLWPPTGSGSPPPVNGAFYGDFGLAPKAGEERINSLPQQLRYGPGLVAGFRVHASARQPWVQFGLTSRDLQPTKSTFRLERSQPGSTSTTGVPFYKPEVIVGTLNIRTDRKSDQRDFSRERTGMILDTGAQTTIHQGTKPVIPLRLTAKDADKRIVDGALITARGKSIDAASKGKSASILRTIAGRGSADRVAIQDTGQYYLNTGIRPFLSHDVVYNLADAQLILIPRTTSGSSEKR